MYRSESSLVGTANDTETGLTYPYETPHATSYAILTARPGFIPMNAQQDKTNKLERQY